MAERQRPCSSSAISRCLGEVERLQHRQLAALHVQAQEVEVPHLEVRQHIPADAHTAAMSGCAASAAHQFNTARSALLRSQQ